MLKINLQLAGFLVAISLISLDYKKGEYLWNIVCLTSLIFC